SDGAQATEYLREMLDQMEAQEFHDLAISLQRETEEMEKLSGAGGAPDLRPILSLLDALGRIAANSPSGASHQDVADLIALASGFSQALWKLSQYFSGLVQQTGAAGR